MKNKVISNIKIRYKHSDQMKQFADQVMSLARQTSKLIGKKVREGTIPQEVHLIDLEGDKVLNLKGNPTKKLSLEKGSAYIHVEDYTDLDDYKEKRLKPASLRDDPEWFGEIFKDVKNKSLGLSITEGVINRYASYQKRNKKLPPYVEFKKEAFNIRKNTFSFDPDKMQVIFNGLDGNKIYLDIDVEKSVLFKQPDFEKKLESKNGQSKKDKSREEIIKGAKFGANIIFEQNLIVATTECEKELPYEPEEFFGPDINKDSKYWLTYPISMPSADNPDGSFYFSKPEEIQKIEEELVKVNDLINETFKTKGEERSTEVIEFKGKKRKRNSQTRRVLRRYWQELHKKQMKLIRNIPQLEKVFKFCETNQLGYAHDDITTGQKNGSFAQDKIRKIVQERQRKTGLPVSYTKPAYTSQTCPECGKRDNKNRDGDKFKCVECGYENVSHVVGAINICRFAQEQFTENANSEKGVRAPL